MSEEPRKYGISGSAGRMLAVGLDFGLSLMVGFFGGRFLDNKLGTAPWFMLLGLIVGVGAGIKLLIERTKDPKSKS